MKKLLLSVFSFVLATTLYAQKDVTKFLGIPVDGTKEEMIQKLKAKGFRSSSYNREILEGEFNGQDVNVHIATNNNKVYRIMVCDQKTIGERDIKIRFNNLCQQFKNNEKYISLLDNYSIPDDENIRYEILVHKKRYEAIFYQKPDMTDTLAIQKIIEPIISSKYTQEELDDMTPEQLQELMQYDPDWIKLAIDWMMKKSVWFMISKYYGKYYIAMYYDNKYNEANGEDL